jgi:phosphoribosylformylglycinamidine (FGAM) synthase-like amidotransferase family enzyme
MTIAIVKFPGTNSEKDVFRALSVIPGARPYIISSRDGVGTLNEADALVIPSGVSIDEYVSVGAEKCSLDSYVRMRRDDLSVSGYILGCARSLRFSLMASKAW